MYIIHIADQSISDRDKRNILSPSVDSSATAGSGQKAADFGIQQRIAPANGAIAMLDTKEKLRHLLMSVHVSL